MLTTPTSLPRSSGGRWLRRLLLLVVVAVAGGVIYLYRVAGSALPQLDGTLAVSGLRENVAVTRDGHGVPTIDAANLDDLFFAQGYVTAQDRLWQMDIMRRFAAGDTAEILGPDMLPHDREQRTLGLRGAARRAAAALSPRDRSFFDAYVRGVNASLEAQQGHLPIEFRLIGYRPQPWTLEDCFLIGARMVQDLNHGTYHSALAREKILAKLGPELTADLFVNFSSHDHPPEMEGVAPEQRIPAQSEDDDDMDSIAVARFQSALPQLPGHDPLRAGSNNWVVSGEHTISGKPLLANDMHLDHQMPNLWYEAHLRAGDLDAAGVTLPGVPFVIVGHNQRIAWGFTNVGPTVEDVFVEEFNAEGKYRTSRGWSAPEHRVETIHVKGQPDVKLDVVVTRHGPLISELVPGEARKLALQWTLYEAFNTPFFDLDTAQNWEQFRRALSTWGAPGQNAVYADVAGHIGYQATGRVPIRATGDGSLPVSGSDDAHEWKGYVPFDDMPRVYDPPSGILGTANGRISPDKYRYSLSTEWDAPWRTERIYRVLESGKQLSAADMLALQTDVYSAFDQACAEQFATALSHARSLSPRAQQARDLLRDWDGRVTADSTAATITVRSRRQLARLLLEPKLGSAPPRPEDDNEGPLSWKTYGWSMSSVWLENVLTQRPARWLPAKYADYDALLIAAVEAVISSPEAPADLKSWRWGEFAPIEIRHLVLERLPLIGRWTGPGLHPQSGGSYTVKQVGRGFGPSERLTVDLADFDHSTLNVVTGQAGNFLSPYYMDQWKAWFEGRTFELPYSADAVQRSAAHRLLLSPSKPEAVSTQP
jgi:penicillin amidase